MCSGVSCSYSRNHQPRLAAISSSHCLSEQTWRDLHLDPILGELLQVKEFLMHPCDREELLARQRVFTEIRDSEGDQVYASMVACRKALFALQHALEIWKDARTAVERTYLFVEVLRAYRASRHSLGALHGSGRLREVASYFQNRDDAPLSDAIDQAQVIIERIFHVRLSYGDRQWSFARDDASEGGAVYETLSACAEKLGLAFAVKKKSPVYMDQYLSDAFISLYHSEFRQLELLLAPFRQVDLEAPLDYVPSLDFYLQMEDFYRRAEGRGIVRCIPTISDEKQFCLQEMYDFTLLASADVNIVPNPTFFTSEKPFFFLVGANGGGKTTYLRAIGANLVLLMAGCPVMARCGVGYPFTSVHTHYPSDEHFSGKGRLDDEQRRIGEMLDGQDRDGFFLFNETFSGANDEKGSALAMELAERMRREGRLGLFVTHFHQVIGKDFPVLSVGVSADEGEGEREHHSRTYRVSYEGAQAYSYAEDILRKYGMDRNALRARLSREGGAK